MTRVRACVKSSLRDAMHGPEHWQRQPGVCRACEHLHIEVLLQRKQRLRNGSHWSPNSACGSKVFTEVGALSTRKSQTRAQPLAIFRNRRGPFTRQMDRRGPAAIRSHPRPRPRRCEMPCSRISTIRGMRVPPIGRRCRKIAGRCRV